MTTTQLPGEMSSAKFWELMIGEELLFNSELPFSKEDWPKMQSMIPAGLVCPDLGCKGTLNDHGQCLFCGLQVENCKTWLHYLRLDIMSPRDDPQPKISQRPSVVRRRRRQS